MRIGSTEPSLTSLLPIIIRVSRVRIPPFHLLRHLLRHYAKSLLTATFLGWSLARCSAQHADLRLQVEREAGATFVGDAAEFEAETYTRAARSSGIRRRPLLKLKPKTRHGRLDLGCP
jgi:hypothetical protein